MNIAGNPNTTEYSVLAGLAGISVFSGAIETNLQATTATSQDELGFAAKCASA
jgi:hypothetical protein